MTAPSPVLAGVTLPPPRSWERIPVPLVSAVTLAGGRVSRYHRGHRTMFELAWRNLRPDVAEALDAVARTRGPVSFVDQDGRTYVVHVDDYSGLEAVPGTDPPRYHADVRLAERDAR